MQGHMEDKEGWRECEDMRDQKMDEREHREDQERPQLQRGL